MASRSHPLLFRPSSSIAALGSTSPCVLCRLPLSQIPRQTPARFYAQHAHHAHHAHHSPDPRHSLPSGSSPRLHEDLAWPEPQAPQRVPTPYQILAVRRGEVYTKRRFYALAKLYHPDSCSHASSPVAHVPHAERLERYRLIVAAHGILSDDSKRVAYDLWGSGWTEHAHAHVPVAPYAHPAATETRSWDDDPLHNATWEDWERWRRRNEEGGATDEKQTVYMSNLSFMTMILFLVSLGTAVQGARAGTLSATALEQRERVHKEASFQLARSQRATMATGDRDERVRSFVEHREATLAGQPSYERLFPRGEKCGSGSATGGQ